MGYKFLIVCPSFKSKAEEIWQNIFGKFALSILYLKRGEDEIHTAMIAHDIEFDNFSFA